jgi:acyl-CoA thioester hydrolase
MPEPKRITLSYRVPYADTDQMHVVYYANYLTFFERGRNELMRACGITYRELEAGGSALPVLEAHVQYHAPATYDDLLEITAWCAEFKGVRLKICCEVRRGGKLLAEGYTVHAHVGIATLRPARPAPAFLAALGFLSDGDSGAGDSGTDNMSKKKYSAETQRDSQ